MKQFLSIEVDNENVKDCSCIALGSEINLAIAYTELSYGCGDDGSLSIKVTNLTDSTVYVDETEVVPNGSSDYTSDTYTFTANTPGVYDIQFTLTICGEDFVYQTQITICPAGEVVFNSCGSYTFTNTYDNPVILSIKTPSGAVIVEGVSVLAGDSYTFSLTTTGIYILYYLLAYTTDDDVVVAVTYTVQVNFFCPIETCLLSLLTQVLCQSTADPCCNLCNQQEKDKIELLRFELNKLLGLYGYYLGLNFYQRIKYFGIFQMTDEVLVGLVELNDVITKIVAISGQCGLLKCQEDQLKSVDCGCSG